MRILDCILLVDDDPASLFISKKVISNMMISKNVDFLPDGCKAIQYVEEYQSKTHKLPDLIFLDIKMPECDGFDFMNFVNNKYPTLANGVVVLSNSSNVQDKESMKKLGIKHYMTKPITLDKLGKFLAADSHIPFML